MVTQLMWRSILLTDKIRKGEVGKGGSSKICVGKDCRHLPRLFTADEGGRCSRMSGADEVLYSS